MTKKVIPFPQAKRTVPPSVPGPPKRLILNLGNQRIAVEISCQATLLNPVPATVAAAPWNGRGGKVRKAPKP